MRDLPRLVSTAAPDAAAPVTVWRNGQRQELNVTLGEAPENPQTASLRSGEPGQEDKAEALGMRLARADPRVAPEAARSAATCRASSSPGSNAAARPKSFGLARGDVLVSINQEPVSDPDDGGAEAEQDRELAAKERAAAVEQKRHVPLCRGDARQGCRINARAQSAADKKRAPEKAPFFAGIACPPWRSTGRPISDSARRRGIAAAAIMRGQRHPRFKTFEFDAGAGSGPQQPVGGFAQRRSVLLRVLRQGRVEGGKKSGDIGIDAGAQLMIDKRAGTFLAGDGVGPGLPLAERWSGPGPASENSAASGRLGAE